MTTSLVQQTQDGQELEQADLAIIAAESARADDHVIAELVRLPPYNGTAVAKAILKHDVFGVVGATVAPNGATGSVRLKSFRAIAGTRVGPGTSSTDPVDTTGALLNWRDIRSVVYAVSDDGSTLGHAVALAANSSGTSRWDLVYATLQTDQNGPNVNRFVQAPNTAPPTSTTSVVGTIVQVLSVGVVTGTPSATPAVPALPSDTLGASGTYNIPLAYVQVPNGFSGTSTVTTAQIWTVAPVVPLSKAFGATTVRPPTGLSTGLPSSATQTWGSGGTRTPTAMPTTMVGSERLLFVFDATTTSPIVADTGVLDSLVDWRNRMFRTEVTCVPGANGVSWQGIFGNTCVPTAGASGAITNVQRGQSSVDDSLAVMGASRAAGTVYFANNAIWTGVASGSNAFGLYVDMSTGNLKVFYQGQPGQRYLIELEAYAAFDNQ